MPELSVTPAAAIESGAFEMTGRWWLASAPDTVLGGILRFDGHQGVLELTGELVDEAAIRDPVTVFGWSADGEAITIPGAWFSSARTSRSERGPDSTNVTQTFGFFELFRGSHFEDGDDQLFSCVTFTTPSLAAWINRRLFDDDHKVGVRTIKIETPAPVTIPLLDGELVLEWIESSTSGLNVSIRLVPTFVWLPSSPTTLDLARRSVAQPIEFFLTIATGHTVDLDQLGVSAHDPTNEFGRQAQLTTGRDDDFVGASDWGHWEHLVPYTRVESELPVVLARWIELARENRSAMVQYFAGALAQSAYMEEIFLSTVRALEIWHRGVAGGTVMPSADFDSLMLQVRATVPANDWTFLKSRLQHANEPSLKQRLDAMVAGSEDPFAGLIRTFSRFTRRVVDTRNIFTHSGTQGDRPFDDHELFFAQKACAVLFSLVVLQAAGLGELAAERLPHTSDWRWLTGESNPLIRI